MVMVCRKRVILKVYFSSFFSPGFASYFRICLPKVLGDFVNKSDTYFRCYTVAGLLYGVDYC